MNSKYVIVSHTEFQPIVRKFHWITWKSYINRVCYSYDKIQLKFQKSLRTVVSKLKSTEMFSAENVSHTGRRTWPAIAAFLLTFFFFPHKKRNLGVLDHRGICVGVCVSQNKFPALHRFSWKLMSSTTSLGTVFCISYN
jgi:hypothetical protein